MKSPKVRHLTIQQAEKLNLNGIFLKLANGSIKQFGHYVCTIGGKPYIITN